MVRCVLCALMSLVILIGCKEVDDNRRKALPNTRLMNPEWQTTSPKGIRVGANDSTIMQYEERWSSEWDKIDWSALDSIFDFHKHYYCYQLGWDCKDAAPSQVLVYIMPWDRICVDAETPEWPYEIYAYLNGGWVCWDGWFTRDTGELIIYIHLGDDPGVNWSRYNKDVLEEFYAFEASAYPHELYHFFQAMSGREVTDNDPIVPYGVTMIPSPDDIVLHVLLD